MDTSDYQRMLDVVFFFMDTWKANIKKFHVKVFEKIL